MKNEIAVNAKNTSSNTKVSRKEKRRSRSLDVQKSRMGWLFVAPFLIGFLLIYLPMIVESIRFSFGEISIQAGGGYVLLDAGWSNYSYALSTDPQFTTTLVGSLTDLAFDVPAIVIFSLFMAVLLNQKMRGRAIFRAIFFIPVIVSTGIIESIDKTNSLISNMEQMNGGSGGSDLEGTNSGAQILSVMDLTSLFRGMQIGAGIVEYVVSLVNDVYNIVNKSGVQMLIFLAGLQSISPAIYESCHIDGASSWETFWKITFPMISPMILVNTVYTVIDSFTSKSNEVMQYIGRVYESTAANARELSSAMSWLYFLIVLLLIGGVALLLSAFVFYQRRD
jgi:ABC-type sugar transport system permease subunit